jgi:phospholipid/cholesterol/gamma-HCH transport system permease protein
MNSWLERIGAAVLTPITALGGLALLGLRALGSAPHLERRELVRTIARFGLGSLGLTAVVALGTGAVIVIETSSYTVRFGARDILGGMAGISILREFGPLMMALVMAGWVGAANAAEVGNLNLGGQLGSLRGVGVDPFAAVLAPRLYGTWVAMITLALCADLCAVLGGAFAAKVALGIEVDAFLRSFRQWLHMRDLVEGLIKTSAFAFAIALLSTRAGLRTRGGARAVGERVADSVVHAVVSVLVLDFLVTALIGGRL